MSDEPSRPSKSRSHRLQIACGMEGAGVPRRGACPRSGGGRSPAAAGDPAAPCAGCGPDEPLGVMGRAMFAHRAADWPRSCLRWGDLCGCGHLRPKVTEPQALRAPSSRPPGLRPAMYRWGRNQVPLELLFTPRAPRQGGRSTLVALGPHCVLVHIPLKEQAAHYTVILCFL